MFKFCFKLGKITLETHRMLKEAFGDNTLAKRKEGQMSINYAQLS